MTSESPDSKGRDNTISTLDGLIQVLDLAKDTCGIPPAQAAFGAVSALLTIIRDSIANKEDYIGLGLECADICQALDRGLNGRRLDELGQSVLGAIGHLTTTVAGIQRKIVKRGKRNAISRALYAKNDKGAIAAWKQDLNRILHIFNTELLIHMVLSDSRRGTNNQSQSTPPIAPVGESPPPPPRVCFGRKDLIDKAVGFAENLEPVALIGAGGIGKTSIALAVLHHPHIKERFGDNRRFIRCDQFPASRTHFLARLSSVIGATGIEILEDLAPLRPFLSSKEMFIILDNAESILDPQGPDGRGLYSIVDELSRFGTISLCITSRITTIPRHYKRPVIPTLSMDAACDIFYSIYDDHGRSSTIDNLLRRLDFHALSITLLATTASYNMWDYDRLVNEWDARRVQVLQTDHDESLAATIELSLTSPMFRKLGPVARDLLGVIAFFPQGVDEKNLDWLFPTIPDRKNIFDKLCVLSLAYRSNGFITMLAPIRDYLHPQDPKSSPLLCATKDCYFIRLSVRLDPNKPEFGEARWIRLEVVNIEHLLDVFTTIDANTSDVWEACVHFTEHLYWQKRRQTVLGPKIERLPEDHPFKPRCLFNLSRLFESVGNHVEKKRLLFHVLKLEKERGDDNRVAEALICLSALSLQPSDFYEGGVQQAKEALEIYERLDDAAGQAYCLDHFAPSLYEDGQLDAAEEAAFRSINLFLEKGQEFFVCQCHRFLGNIYHSKGETQKAVHHYDTALGTASVFNWHNQLFNIHHALALLFRDEDEFVRAHVHIEQAKLHAVEDTFRLGWATETQAWIWYRQRRLEDTASEALRASEIYEKLGATKDAEECRKLLRKIEELTKS